MQQNRFVVSAHQPDLAPYTGFWWKLAHSDIMDLRITAQYVERGYQRRIKMRGDWANLVLDGKQKYEPINKVKIKNPESRAQLIKTIEHRYRKAPFFKERAPGLLDAINEQTSVMLWEFNLGLLVYIRDEALGIKTPFSIGFGTEQKRAEGIVDYLSAYPKPLTYLSGQGARKYMSDTAPFTRAGISVEWTRHAPVTGDSIVSVLMDYEDPMEIVMREREVEPEPEQDMRSLAVAEYNGPPGAEWSVEATKIRQELEDAAQGGDLR
jgi:hypothetical protein